MDYLIMKYIDYSYELHKNVYEIMAELEAMGEEKQIALLLEILKPGDVRSCYRACHFSGMMDTVWYFREEHNYKFPENTRFNFMYTFDVMFILYTLYRIPIEFWEEPAKEFCKILEKFLKSDVETIDDLPEFNEYYYKYEHLEKTFRRDPRFAENFMKYSTEMGN